MKFILYSLLIIVLFVLAFIADVSAKRYAVRSIASFMIIFLLGSIKLPLGYSDNMSDAFYLIIAALALGISLFYNLFGIADFKKKLPGFLSVTVVFSVLFYTVFLQAYQYINLNFGAETTQHQAVISEIKKTDGKSSTNYYCTFNDTGERYCFTLSRSEKNEFEQKTGGEKKDGDTITYIKGKGCLGTVFTYPDTNWGKSDLETSSEINPETETNKED